MLFFSPTESSRMSVIIFCTSSTMTFTAWRQRPMTPRASMRAEGIASESPSFRRFDSPMCLKE